MDDLGSRNIHVKLSDLRNPSAMCMKKLVEMIGGVKQRLG